MPYKITGLLSRPKCLVTQNIFLRIYSTPHIPDSEGRTRNSGPKEVSRFSCAFDSTLFIEETPFSIQHIQTDRGHEFFATKVQQKLMEYCIKFRPIRPGSPHLNGKVERSQKTDLEEFYETVDVNSPDIDDQLQEWQHYYNWNRPHGSLGGKTPMDRYFEVSQKALFWDQVEAMYVPATERVQEQNYQHYLRCNKIDLS